VTLDEHDKLLTNQARTAAAHLRGDGRIRLVAQAKWSDETAKLIHERVCEWLRSGDLAHLANLLRDFPPAVAHPVVYGVLKRLHRITSLTEIAKLAGEADLDGEPVSPRTCKLASSTLHDLTSALVNGLLGSGWSVSLRSRNRGRPRRNLEEIAEAYDVEGDYRRVLESLSALELRWRKIESRDQCHRRLKPILRRVWTQTIGSEIGSEPPQLGADPFDRQIVLRPLEIPDKTLTDGLDDAATRPGGALRRDTLAYHLVGYRRHLRPNKVKYLVETARDLDK
jgi:hypothetical protein